MRGLKLWIAASTLLLSVLLTACGTPASSSQSATSPTTEPVATATTPTAAAIPETATPLSTASSEPITLRVAWWGSENRNQRTLKVIELFEKTHPAIKIVPEYSENKDYWTNLGQQRDEGSLPDVLQQDYSRINDWTSQKLLLSLNPYLANGTISLDGIADEQIAGGRIGDSLYGVSLGTNAIALIYDPAKFQAAGLEQPTADWTWEDFQQAALTIHQKLGIYGVERFSNMDFFRLYLKEHGSWLYNDQNNDLGYQDDAVVTSFFQMLVDLQKAGAMTTPQIEADRGINSLEKSLLVSDEAAMKFIWSNQAVVLASAAKRELSLVQTPRTSAGSEGTYLKPSMFFSISSKSAHADAAAAFIDFFVNSPEANQILAAERGVPISPAVRKAIRSELDPIQQQVFGYIGEVESVAAPLNLPDPAIHTRISSEVYDRTLTQLFNGEITPQEAAAQIRTEATAILKGDS